MITFIIPVKSAQLSNDWAAFSKLVERTLGSVCQQKDSDFRVQLVCHELPETDFSHPAVQFVQVDFDPPKRELRFFRFFSFRKLPDTELPDVPSKVSFAGTPHGVNTLAK